MRRTSSKILVPLTVITFMFVSSGCAPEPGTTSSTKNPSKPYSSEQAESKAGSEGQDSSSPQESHTPSSRPLKAEAIDLTCEQVFTPEKLYEFDPNISLLPSNLTISSDVITAQNSLGALNCDLVHPGLGVTVQYGFTKLTQDSAKNQQEHISQKSTGSFEVSRSLTGTFSAPTAQFIKNTYWVSVSSPNFLEPTDAAMWSNLAASSL